MSRLLSFVFLSPLAIGLACVAGGGLPHASTAQVERAASAFPGATAETLEAGRTLYVQRCGGCHNLYPPSKKATGEWPRWVGKMAARAKLVDEQRFLIEHYLITVSPD